MARRCAESPLKLVWRHCAATQALDYARVNADTAMAAGRYSDGCWQDRGLETKPDSAAAEVATKRQSAIGLLRMLNRCAVFGRISATGPDAGQRGSLKTARLRC